jgi:hypothetical protein
MTDHELRELLLQADEAAWLNKSSQRTFDPNAIRSRVRRRSDRNRALVAGIAIVACLSALVVFSGRDGSNPQPELPIAQSATISPKEIDALMNQIAVLEAEARSAKAIVDRLRRTERLTSLSNERAMEPGLPINSTPNEQIERAAGIGVVAADFLAGELDRRQDAAESYRAVVRHFPESQWASIARERLSQMDMMN